MRDIRKKGDNIVGERLHELRIEKGLTQRDVGRCLGLTGQAISNYENGKRQPTIYELIVFADFYKVSLDYLAGRTDNRKIK